jgi:hypothetical protein
MGQFFLEPLELQSLRCLHRRPSNPTAGTIILPQAPGSNQGSTSAQAQILNLARQHGPSL